MKSHWELFQESYNHASQTSRKFVDANIVTAFLIQLTAKEKIELASDTQRDLLYAINLNLLSGKDIEDIKAYIEKVDLENPQHKRLYEAGKMLYFSNDDYNTYGSKSINAQTRESTLSNITPIQNYLLHEPKSRILLNNIAIRHNLLSTNTYKKLIITIEDIILGFYDGADTEPLLIQELGISAEVAKPLAADVMDFLVPLNDPNWQPPAEEEPIETAFENVTATEEITPMPAEQGFSVPATPVARPTVPPIATPPQPAAAPVGVAATAAPGIRTMAQDMEGARSPQRNTFEPIADDGVPTYISKQE